MTSPTTERKPIAIYGATGFTGGLIARELKRRGVDFLIAGRDRGKLEALSEELGDVPLTAVSVDDAAGLRRMLEGCSVVAACAGPFTLHGEPLVAAAAETGTHYLDTTGEQGFMRMVFDRYGARAAETGAALVSGMGFDFVPGDLLAALTADGMGPLEEIVVAYCVRGFKPTHGTALSGLEIMRDRGDDVVVLDNLTTGRKSNIDHALANGAKLVVEDIRDGELVASLLEAEKPEVVFHLAAQIDVRVSAARPSFDAEVNVIGTINMLEAARRAGARRFVYASTGGAIYGETDVVPTPEDTEIRSEAPYGQAKYAGEGYLSLWQRLHGLSTVSLRFGNVYGPRQDPLGEAGVIAIFCGKLLDGGRPQIFGDGRQTRDYVYVGDVVDANLRAAESDVTGAFNVGRGVQTSVIDIVEALAKQSENGFEADHLPARTGEVQHIALDPSRTKAELGWEAQVDLEQGLGRTLDSLR